MHYEGPTYQSTFEEGHPDGTVLWDYKTAHAKARDPVYAQLLTESCKTCWQQASSAHEAGYTVTTPDEEWVNDGHE